jgi:hypothetical protein
MTVPEALRVDTDRGIKPDMAFLALLCEVVAQPISSRARISFLSLPPFQGYTINTSYLK